MHYAAKVDESQKKLVPFLRAHGASFQSMAPLGKGAPDGLIGFLGVTDLAEFKTGTGKVSANQITWHREWRGSPVVVLRTEADCLTLLEDMRRRSRLLRAA